MDLIFKGIYVKEPTGKVIIGYTDWKGVEQNLSCLEVAEIMFKCAYMRTSPNDNTTFKSLLDKYGVVINE